MWLICRGQPGDDHVEQAMELDELPDARDCLRGWLLATPDDAKIAERTRVPEQVLRAYRHLFFDVHVFRNHLQLVSWARHESSKQGASQEGIQYIRWAIMYGVEAVAYMSGLPANIDPITVQTHAMIDGHFQSLAGREAGIDTPAGREALKHRQLATSQAAILAKRGPATGGVAIKLKHRELTSPINHLGDVQAEVLH